MAAGKRKPPRFVPVLEGSFERLMDQLAGMKSKNPATLVGSLFKVFLPYITYDTVFLNDRAVQEIGLDLRAMRGFDQVAVVEVMGRHAGWLAAAAALAREGARDPPHQILQPETPVAIQAVLERIDV